MHKLLLMIVGTDAAADHNAHESMMQPEFKKAWQYLLTEGTGK